MMRCLLPLAALAAVPAAAQGIAPTMLQPGETLLEVQAEGEVRLRPDTAGVSLGVTSTGTTAREATDANARQMAAVIAAVKKAGVGDRFIRTQQINLQPRFARADPNDWQGQPRITGYVATNTVVATITKLDTVPTVMAAAFDAGANTANSFPAGTDDPLKGIAEARADAIRNATKEAEDYARSLGLRVARVLRVSERGFQTRQEIVVTGSRAYASAPPPPPPPPAPPTPYEAGELRRSVNVWVDFALAK